MHPTFNHQEAFSRNLGWITGREMEILRHKKVAIAGMGGVGGAHALLLARFGVTRFHISDMDIFELANFNRQVGAMMSTIGKSKVDVMADMIRDINPHAEITVFPDGIHDDLDGKLGNIDAFLNGVDLFIDGFDFFVLDTRMAVFKRCHELSIPAITAAPVGMGVALLTFMPDGMSAEDYFRLDEEPVREDRYVKFLIGLTPRPLHPGYLVDPSRVNMKEQKVPSTPTGVQLSAGFLVTEAVKIMLGRGVVRAAPRYQLFDAYRCKMIKGYMPMGNANPLQKLKFAIGRRMYAKMAQQSPARSVPAENGRPENMMGRILDMARWAPSGDNTQPWRFEVVSDKKLIVHIPPIDSRNPYEYNNGQPTYLSVGMLLETIRLAADAEQHSISWKLEEGAQWDGSGLKISVQFRSKKSSSDDLSPFIPLRSVDRRRYRNRRLTPQQKAELEKELAGLFDVTWLESDRERRIFSKLNAIATDIRLRMKECFQVHEKIIDWSDGDSKQGIPATALGIDSMSLKFMKWAMEKWSRMDFMNKYLGGTLLARVQMDLVPGYFCGAHFILNWSEEAERGIEDYLKAGEKLQRFWLRATEMGLALQPSLAPLCFANSLLHGQELPTGQQPYRQRTEQLVQALKHIAGEKAERVVFAGRIGQSTQSAISSRSIRRDLATLLVGKDQADRTTAGSGKDS
ncbi:ThiF family adenylyltransferase [Emcibacter sp.]|uniref:ThiF family adenylyltransferase n=1 Tax=Emcibacter sp. TaxID=1979954 RepID=UPI002AA81A8A|nr:ThiF family adenylyltransferase [Emcibacter sp.]